MPEARTAGKLGLIHRELPEAMGLLKAYLANPLGAPPASVMWPASLSACGMLGNGPDPTAPDYPDGVGDCTIAGTVHLRMLAALLAGETENWPNGDQTIAAYMALSGGQDNGLVEADVLKTWQTQGILGNRISAFAPLDITDDAEIRAACALFGATKVDVDVPANAMTQFNAGEPWHLDGTPADNEIEGGHSVVRCGYYNDAKWGPVWGLLTWGTVQLATQPWMVAHVVQDWVVLTSEFVVAKPGLVNVPALQADIAKLAS